MTKGCVTTKTSFPRMGEGFVFIFFMLKMIAHGPSKNYPRKGGEEVGGLTSAVL